MDFMDDDILELYWQSLPEEEKEAYRLLATTLSPGELRALMVNNTENTSDAELPTPSIEDIPSMIDYDKIEEITARRTEKLLRPFKDADQE